MTGLTADTAGAWCRFVGGLDDMTVFARAATLLGFREYISGDVILGFVFGTLRAAALLGFEGNISGDVILGFVFGSLRAAALLGWFRRGGVLIDFLGDREDQVGDLLGEVISAAVGSGDIVRDVINKVFYFFHECDGKKRCVRRHDRRIK